MAGKNVPLSCLVESSQLYGASASGGAVTALNRARLPGRPGLLPARVVGYLRQADGLHAACFTEATQVVMQHTGRHHVIRVAGQVPLGNVAQPLAVVQRLQRTLERAQLQQLCPVAWAEIAGEGLHADDIIAPSGQQ